MEFPESSACEETVDVKPKLMIRLKIGQRIRLEVRLKTKLKTRQKKNLL